MLEEALQEVENSTYEEALHDLHAMLNTFHSLAIYVMFASFENGRERSSMLELCECQRVRIIGALRAKSAILPNWVIMSLARECSKIASEIGMV